MRTLLILRTHIDRPSALEHAQTIAGLAGYDFCVALDPSHGRSILDLSREVLVTDQTIEDAGLFHRGFNARWQCGDYALYLSYLKYPDYDFYWMIEHDVFFNFSNLKEVFGQFDERSNCDFLTTKLERPPTSWLWINSMTRWGVPAVRCFFPVGRFSNKAVRILLEKRCLHTCMLESEISENPDLFKMSRIVDVWPNDEVFVASVLKNERLICEDINNAGRTYYDDETFRFNRFVGRDQILRGGFTERMHHSVLDEIELAEKRRKRPDLFAVESPSHQPA